MSAPIHPWQDGIAKELRAKGYNVPFYPVETKTAQDGRMYKRGIKNLAGKCRKSPSGNSDGRVAAPVKAYAQKNPRDFGARPTWHT